MQSQCVAHHVRNDDVTFDLMDREEQQRDPDRRDRMDDERIEERRDRPEPRSKVGNELRDRDERAEEECVLLPVGKPSEHAEEPQAHAGARADDQRDE